MSKRIDDLLIDLKHKKFQVDCLHMRLLNRTTKEEYAGQGYIRQKEDQGFEVRIWSPGKLDLHIPQFDQKKVGTLFGEDDFFSLEAKDSIGQTWRAHRITKPQCGGVVWGDGYIVEADSNQISLHEDSCYMSENNSVRIRCFDSIEFPRTMAEFESNNLKFHFKDDEGLTVIANAEDESLLPPQLDERVGGRIPEAITFALGAIPRWITIGRSGREHTVTRFRNPSDRETRPRQRSPYKFRRFDGNGSILKMFDRYLTYVFKDTTTPFHALSQHVFSVCNTRTSSIQGQALAVAVAVESVLNDFFQNTGLPGASICAEIEALRTYVKCWKVNRTIADRANGEIAKLLRARPFDRLRALISEKVIEKKEAEAWRKLRNMATHGGSNDNLQELIDLTYTVGVLLNRLVFKLIGYEGLYTNYGTHGWPECHHPQSQPQPSLREVPRKYWLGTCVCRPNKNNRYISSSQRIRVQTQRRTCECLRGTKRRLR